jgi:hypothetical protein
MMTHEKKIVERSRDDEVASKVQQGIWENK